MRHPTLYPTLLLAMLLSSLLAGCNDGPKTYDACMLKASRESQNDRQFKKLSEACKAQYPDR
jgi:entry exclusion lipoprotein TrbK